MAWTYSGDPAASLKDQVRFLVGDTDESTPWLTDEEIAYLLAQNDDDPYAAAVAACMSIVAKVSGKTRVTIGTVTVDGSLLADQYRKLADDLRNATPGNYPRPVFGGITVAEHEQLDSDESLMQPEFWVGQFDNKGG